MAFDKEVAAQATRTRALAHLVDVRKEHVSRRSNSLPLFCYIYREAVANAENSRRFGATPSEDEIARYLTLTGVAHTKSDAHEALQNTSTTPDLLVDIARMSGAIRLIHWRLNHPCRPETGATSSASSPNVKPSEINAAAKFVLYNPSMYKTQWALISADTLSIVPGGASEACCAHLRGESERIRRDLVRFETELASPGLVHAPLLSASATRAHSNVFDEDSTKTFEVMDDFSRLYRGLWEGSIGTGGEEEGRAAQSEANEGQMIGRGCVRMVTATECWHKLRVDSELALRCIRAGEEGMGPESGCPSGMGHGRGDDLRGNH